MITWKIFSWLQELRFTLRFIQQQKKNNNKKISWLVIALSLALLLLLFIGQNLLKCCFENKLTSLILPPPSLPQPCNTSN